MTVLQQFFSFRVQLDLLRQRMTDAIGGHRNQVPHYETGGTQPCPEKKLVLGVLLGGKIIKYRCYEWDISLKAGNS